ncbi:MAG: 30S ribosomal protein S4 [Candidatus Levybacteria bacterium CG_4_9_14_3_um_filter_35_16]|nr:MAG: 30S ribosomal protein S4 [Candidatus Levybacteria bacterium CG22_combo_CG10-13_8_21_14_all_35_11]PIY93847.1 MAG: 30S ribosomal protein S4 [Candidatus Levybacteria bacterium CG_4_10_14_0_8_um_filter_35_23]PIZ97154.1 MAG: 30S ribosomal protein S4 [Candidatus Levybacteria bacterium CG_4_10_14_0_2_um_filter_35_8]PJA91358.1 MAG: 30S ribosomal protein S4 [Candidatus Levybacteria bacterium CG_4_9_14_3_um_filter_35_16]PJC54797.1 MAG: 30S ribosomal protein S4 [Candidatus Levybacteria bacterium C
MARYTGPKHKLARKVGVNLLDKTSNSLQRRLNVPPGVHGKKRKRRLSEYGLQMKEKQKAKITYGLLEKQLKNLVKAVQTKKGETGEMILSLLETRLDNMVYRLGFAKTRMNARQFVSHGHILVNGKKVTIPSFQVKIDSEITIAEKIKQNPQFLSAMEEKEGNVLPFLKKNKLSGKLVRMPKKDDLEIPFDMQLIIEYYSR